MALHAREPRSRACKAMCDEGRGAGSGGTREPPRPPRPAPRPSPHRALHARDLGSRACKAMCDEGRGAGPGGRGVYLDLTEAARRLGADVLRERYGNLFELYEHITGDDPLRGAMRIAP